MYVYVPRLRLRTRCVHARPFSEESARNTADVYRAIEPNFDFEVRQGRGGWMIARLKKDGTFDSWVEE